MKFKLYTNIVLLLTIISYHLLALVGVLDYALLTLACFDIDLEVHISSMVIMEPYSRRGLLMAGKQVLSGPTKCRLDHNTYTLLKKLGISSAKPTHRGKRSGKHVKARTVLSHSIDSSALLEISSRTGTVVTSKNIKLSLCNARSVLNKWDSIIDYIVENDLDILAITETWISPDNINDYILNELPHGYSLLHVPRPTRRGGGVGIIYRDSLNPIIQPKFKALSFEYLEALISVDSHCLRLIVLYRPPPSTKNGLTKGIFYQEFADFLAAHIPSTGKLLITGDFNFHWNDINSQDTQHMAEIIDSANLIQHVKEATHTSGHTLDWVITHSEDDIVSKVEVSTPLSDHNCVDITLNLKKTPLPRKTISFRQYKKIDKELFVSDLRSSDLVIKPAATLEELTDQYNKALTDLANKHAPLKSKTVTLHPIAPWYTDKVRELKSTRRQCEKRWRDNKLTVHREAYKEARNAVNQEIAKAKTGHYKLKVSSCGNDQKALFRVIDDILTTKDKRPLPQHTDVTELLDTFSTFFQQKISRIRENLDAECIDQAMATVLTSVLPIDDTTPAATFTTFEQVTIEDVAKLIMASPTKSCALDPIPTWLLKEFCDPLAPVISQIINLSLQTGYLPSSMKKALVTPLLKKLTLDKECLKNYRPVSNLAFVSKLIEKACLKQLSGHMSKHHLHTRFQSAYQPLHSTETALLKIQNDLLISLDGSKGIMLLLLDLSAAFDTIDHDVLLSRLKSRIGVEGTVLQWFTSYLSERSQVIYIDGKSSTQCCILKYGVPQGSVAGPFTFIIYTGPMQDIAIRHGLSIHMYADDTQVYIEFDLTPASAEEAQSKLECCVADISKWMKDNKLQLNEEKTELVVITPSRQSKKVHFESVKVGNCDICPANSARNLGATFDSHMTLQPHVSSLVKSCNWQLRRIGQIRKFLTEAAAEKLIHAFISSRLDNGNALLYGLPDYQLNRLQRVHNTAARILTRTRKYEHITPILADLHWLPIKHRITYKLMTLTYKCLNGLAPQYLADLLVPYSPVRSLRSSESLLLTVPKTRTKVYGDRAFKNSAPKLWNNLPLCIRNSTSFHTFKSKLKQYLYKESFKRI
jgi:exonuclease III